MNKNILIVICMVLFSASLVFAAGNFNLSSSAGSLIFGGKLI